MALAQCGTFVLTPAVPLPWLTAPVVCPGDSMWTVPAQTCRDLPGCVMEHITNQHTHTETSPHTPLQLGITMRCIAPLLQSSGQHNSHGFS
jgi:hypothetical protein